MSLAAYIDATGIHAPTYAQVLASLQASYQGIFGSDAYLGSDSQDGQLLAIFAQAISDCNSAAIQVFNAYSPAFAQGTGLSTSVKINGLARLVSSNSTATLTIIGQAGTIITNGSVGDTNSNTWLLPASVTIPVGGSISVTATAQNPGAIPAAIGSITQIQTPTLGWQSATNPAVAVLGNPVETDAALRIRQSLSVAQPGQTTVDAIASAIGNTAGVTRYVVYENATNATDANGVPAHTIAPIVQGGTVAAVATAIQSRKPPGIQTYGTTSYQVLDPVGLPITINYYTLAQTNIYAAVTIKALPGYLSTTGTALINAIVQMINGFSVGEYVYLGRLYSPANLSGDAATTSSGLTQAQLDALSNTYNITALTIGFSSGSLGTADLAIAFNAAAACTAANITLTVT